MTGPDPGPEKGVGFMRRSIIRGFSVLVLLFLVGLSAAFAAGDPEIEYPETVRIAREILWKSVTSGGVNYGSGAVMDKGKIVVF